MAVPACATTLTPFGACEVRDPVAANEAAHRENAVVSTLPQECLNSITEEQSTWSLEVEVS
jgi:hypothetical protein